ncbi:T9SS type B sorting domain-containing protein [Flavobacterium sp.]|uniref:T9SS type B sorting domain-containing protein n=1 Tax=Flavobacterium sp. TaxID=239 RepID=UPI00261D568B|nr:T9SS type B sorting domain-containing protein [Flavobacterium sp.]
MKFIRYLYIVCFFMTSLCYGQLSDFNFTVNISHETCTNNGKIEMTVSNTTPGAQIIYELFLAPDYTNAFAETTSNSFGGLSSGIYRVVASQSNNGQVNSKQIDLTVEDLIEELDFVITDNSTSNCDTNAGLIVNVISGNAVSYEIISGPELRPIQTSNEFLGLQSGTYSIRVFDDCGDASTKSYNLNLLSSNLIIGPPNLPDVYTSCTSAVITTVISTENQIPIYYPLQVKYSVFAPDGTLSQTYFQTIDTGTNDPFEVNQLIDLFGPDIFNVKIEVTDQCSVTFAEEFPIDPNPKLTFINEEGECGEFYFGLLITNYLPPVSLNFTSPANFNPVEFNQNYPGLFYNLPIMFGDEEHSPPYGVYNVSVQDACGRTGNLDFTIIEILPQPIVSRSNNGCASEFGTVRITIPDNRDVVSVIVTQAPAAFTQPLPADLSSFITPSEIFLHNNLPIGDYMFLVTDSCGDVYQIPVTVPAFVFGNLDVVMRPDCSPTSGSVKLSTTNGKIITMKIVDAPPTFMQVLPYDVSFNINSNGVFYMNNLPAGSYTFTATDICGFELTTVVEIKGYISNSSGFSLTRNCGSFDISINDNDLSITGKTFWLQRYYPNSNSWGHPYTGALYTEGSIPNATNSFKIENYSSQLNVFLLGEFRIIKVFLSFNNGDPDAKCLDTYAQFTISSELIISGVYNLDCTSVAGQTDVVLDVIGVAPFNFKITSPFVLDNGDNNVFSNLAEGSYVFQVKDNCGNIKNITIEIGTLIPLAKANKPKSMLVCREDGVQFGIFPLIDQNAQVLGNQNPNFYKVSYHISQEDADAGINPLPDGYTNISNPQTIYVRVEHKTIANCYATTSFNIFAGLKPILLPVDSLFICEGFTKNLTAQSGFSAYEWSTGETTQSITVSQPGIYTLIVKNVYDDFSCDTVIEYVVEGSSKATIQKIEVYDWSSSNNSITALVTGAGDYTFSLDNINFQTSSTFRDLMSGVYTLYVKDENGCETVHKEFVILNYPKYFTPNGDGFNDTWHIEFSSYEPNMIVDIFDRFGKLITRLKGGEIGWDGTYNGVQLPSTDYWFVVLREDGKTHRGHFSLKR